MGNQGEQAESMSQMQDAAGCEEVKEILNGIFCAALQGSLGEAILMTPNISLSFARK